MALFREATPQVGLWQARQRALVCPRAYRTRDGFDAAVEASGAAGWPVHQRPTGGGPVPQGPGVINLALAFNAPKGFTIEDGYRLLVAVIRNGLTMTDLATGDTPNSFCDGAWNLSRDGQKLVGTAQKWRPMGGGLPRVLAHAMILATDDYRPGTDAVSAFHTALSLPPVSPDAHTSLAACQTPLHTDALHRAARALIPKDTNG